METLIEQAASLVAGAQHLVGFTGAGVSTESGLPDYRGPDGVWTRRDKGLKPKPMAVPWHMVEPNPAHRAFVVLQDLGILKFLISQNVDNLHLKSGIHPDKLAELHGNSTLLKCTGCDHRLSKSTVGWDDEVYGRGYRTSRPVRGQPDCPRCGGRLISSVVNFNDPMPEREMAVATWHAKQADVFLVVGSTLTVTPAADLPVIATASGGKLIILNKGETALDSLADVRLEGRAGEVLMAMVERVEALRSA